MLPGWSESEKRELLAAVRTFGIGNIENLAAAIPTKSLDQVRNAVCFYKIKAMIAEKKQLSVKNHQHETPIKTWIDNLKVASELSSDPDASLDIAAAFRLMDKNEPYDKEGIDFNSCYAFIADVMEGKNPKPIEKKEMTYMAAFFEVMDEFIKEQGTEKEQEFLSNLTEEHILQSADKWKASVECSGSSSSCLSLDADINVLKVPPHLLKIATEKVLHE